IGQQKTRPQGTGFVYFFFFFAAAFLGAAFLAAAFFTVAFLVTIFLITADPLPAPLDDAAFFAGAPAFAADFLAPFLSNAPGICVSIIFFTSSSVSPVSSSGA